MSSLISKKTLIEYSMQPYGPPCGNTISVQIQYDGKVTIGSRNITNLRFADDIDGLAEEE